MIEKKAFKCKTLVLCIQAQNAKKMALTTLIDNACCNTELQWTDMRSGREGDQIIRYSIIIEEN